YGSFGLRRYERLLRIGHSPQQALLDLRVLLLGLPALRVGELRNLPDVARDRLGGGREVEWQHARGRAAQRERPPRTRAHAPIHEIRIAETGVPGEVVVDRVVDAAPAPSRETEVERCDPSVLEKRREVRSRTEGFEPQEGVLADLLSVLG